MDDQQYAEAVECAEKIGTEHGRDAASWVTDGNTTRESYAALLAGIEDGDPMVMDSLPASPLSGEWADGYSPRDLLADCGYDPDMYDDAGEIESELCFAYDDAFYAAVQDEIVRACRYQLGAESA